MTRGILVLAALAFLAAGARGQERIVEVAVEGNRETPADAILRSLGTQAGRTLDGKTIEADVRFLWQKSRIRVEAVEQEAVPGGVRIVFKVAETPVLRDVDFRGNKAFSREKLVEVCGLLPGVGLDEVAVARVRGDLERHHREEGYLFAEVASRIDAEAGKVVFEVSEGPLVRVKTIRFVGNRAIPGRSFLGLGRTLAGEMQLRQGFLFVRGSEFKERVLREDLIAVRRLYRREGYRDAVVEVRDLLFSEDRSEVTVELFVDEGPRYLVASVAIAGNEAFPSEDLLPLLRLAPGGPYTDELLRRDVLTLSRYYGERGYPSHPTIPDGFRVTGPDEVYEEGTARVGVTYRIREGARTRIREVVIEGNATTEDRVIRRELTVEPGAVVNTTEVARSVAQLDGLHYFDDDAGFPSTRYRYEATGDPGWKDLRIDVEEGKTGNLLFGGGVSSVEGAFAQVSILKRNFDLFRPPSSFGSALSEIYEGRAFTGGGQDLQLELAPGTRLSFYRLRFHEPDLFGDHIERTSMTASLFKQVRRFSAYVEERKGESIAFGRNFSRETGVEFALRNEEIDVGDVDAAAPAILFDQEGENTLRSGRLDFAHSRLDVPLEPTQGHALRLSYELAGGPFGADFDFHKVTGTGRFFVRLAEDDRGRADVLALTARLGWSRGFGDTDDVPYTERYFAGGPGSVRGFDFRGIGPRQNGTPVGGEALALAQVEYRFPVYSTVIPGRLDEIELVRGRLFADFGTLGLDVSDESFRELRIGAGVGLSIRIPYLPQLPIALDFGVPLRRERTDEPQAFSFSIGLFN